MNNMRFKTVGELYDRLKPALRSKAHELDKKGYNYIHEEDIWNYLKNYKWAMSQNLDLADMVNDIFSIREEELNDYVKSTIKDYRRKVSEEETGDGTERGSNNISGFIS